MIYDVIKKDGSKEPWDDKKIEKAILKSASRVNVPITDKFTTAIMDFVKHELDVKGIHVSVPVETLHKVVTKGLGTISPEIQKSYQSYRDYKTSFVKTLDNIFEKTKDTLYFGDRENANFDSSLISTKGSIIRGYLTKELFKSFYLSHEAIHDIEDGYIYIHDLRDLIFGGFNCCLFDIGRVLKGGFEMSGIEYQEPNSVLSALQVIGDVVLSATAQQFGGFTLPELDKVLVPYVKKSYRFYREEAKKYSITDQVYEYAYNKTLEELKQGFQSLEMKLNTVPCSRGDFAFTTISFGHLDEKDDYTNKVFQRLIASTMLLVRQQGQGKNHKPVVFPKLVYLYSQESHEKSDMQASLLDAAIECTAKAMYPDYLSLDARGSVCDTYKKTGQIVSPMGCRSFLSEFKDPDTGEYVTTGRANVGVVSLNLPMIIKKAQELDEPFSVHVAHYVNKALDFLKNRFSVIAEMPCSSNPLAFTQGGMYHGTKEPSEKIGMDIAKSFTASLGITALDEVCVLINGCHLHEALPVQYEVIWELVNYINNIVEQRKIQDGFLYSLYGTPAESLCGTQVQQFRKKYGIVEGVSDKEYFTNSFHMNVGADITPLEKQGLEESLFHSCEGGHIQYVRVSQPNNLKGIKSLVTNGMSKGFYQGINFDLAICENCHQRTENTEKCDHCGSGEISVINRVCGYLGWTKLKGRSRMNDAKLAEIQDRKSM